MTDALGNVDAKSAPDVTSAGVTTGGAIEALAECFAFLAGGRAADFAVILGPSSAVELNATKEALADVGTGVERLRFFSSLGAAASTDRAGLSAAAAGPAGQGGPSWSLTLIVPPDETPGSACPSSTDDRKQSAPNDIFFPDKLDLRSVE